MQFICFVSHEKKVKENSYAIWLAWHVFGQFGSITNIYCLVINIA